MLSIDGLTIYHGGMRALTEISISVQRGEVVAIIGPNGAGKSTLLGAISGIFPAQAGRLTFEGHEITRLPPQEIVALGITQVLERRAIFGPLTVMENLELGAYYRYGRTPKAELKRDVEFVFTLFPILEKRKRQVSATMSGGEQQMLVLGRALMSKPKMLLLDEPSLGLAPLVVEGIFAVLRDLHKQGLTILLVEQNARIALEFAHRGYVLVTGQVILHDITANLRQSEDIYKLYLGIRR